jgi:hypothetical protein
VISSKSQARQGRHPAASAAWLQIKLPKGKAHPLAGVLAQEQERCARLHALQGMAQGCVLLALRGIVSPKKRPDPQRCHPQAQRSKTRARKHRRSNCDIESRGAYVKAQV